MDDDALTINLNGAVLDRAGVMAALEERAARIIGELDRVKFDCELPHLADSLSRSARQLHERAVTALDNRAAAPQVVPRLVGVFDALIRDVAMVESSNVPDEGFPTNAQGRALLRLLRFAFRDDAHPGDRAARVARASADSRDEFLLVHLGDGSTGRIYRDGQLSP